MSIDHGKVLALADEMKLEHEIKSKRGVFMSWSRFLYFSNTLRALAQPAEAVEGGWPAIYGMFRAVVDAGGPETIARHGVERGSDQWVSKMRAGMLAIEWRYHPERFDEPPFTDAAQGAVAFVPVHPKLGPLWGDTYPAGDAADGRSPHYERMPLFTHPQAAPAQGDWIKCCGEDGPYGCCGQYLKPEDRAGEGRGDG